MPDKTLTPIPRVQLAYPAPIPFGLEIAIPRANTFFPTSTDVELNESGEFVLVGKWPTHLDASRNLYATEFSVVANRDGIITGIQERSANRSDWIGAELLDGRTLSVLLNAWTDEQIAKSSLGLFEGQAAGNS